MKYTKLLLLGIAFLFQACSNPSIMNVKKEEVYALSEQSIIYIPRFEGNPDFVEESTDYYIANLEASIPNQIIQGSVLRTESTDINSGGNLPKLQIALEYAKKAKSDILIMGKVTSHKTMGSLNGFSTIRIYNVKNGNKIANFHQPSGLLFGYSEHQCVMAAVKNTAKDTANIIK